MAMLIVAVSDYPKKTLNKHSNKWTDRYYEWYLHCLRVENWLTINFNVQNGMDNLFVLLNNWTAPEECFRYTDHISIEFFSGRCSEASSFFSIVFHDLFFTAPLTVTIKNRITIYMFRVISFKLLDAQDLSTHQCFNLFFVLYPFQGFLNKRKPL